MYTLYWSRNTGAVAAQVALEEAGAQWRKTEVDIATGAQQRPEFLALNPLGQVPALALPDGTLMTESAAMVLHLSEAFPAAGLLPPPGSSARARCLRWLVFLAVNPYTADLRVYYPDRHTTDPATVDAVRDAGRRDLDHWLGMFEAQLDPGPLLLGGDFSIVDAYAAMILKFHPDQAAATRDHPRLVRLMDAILERPAVARVWAEHYG